MKKTLYYFIIFILIIFILPAVLTKQTKAVTSTENADKPKEENEVYEDEKIRLLHVGTNEIENIDLEEYICNVVSAEMPADYEIEALKAQAIIARTYTMYKVKHQKHDNADICDDSSCCQAWISKDDRLAKWEAENKEENWSKIKQAVNETKGKIVTYSNEPINAFFHSNSGGTTELPNEVWGGENFPYLQVVQTDGEEGYLQYSSEVTYTYEELINKLKTKYSDIAINFESTEELKILEYTQSGRVRTIKMGNHNLSGVEVRTILGLKSANFDVLNLNGIVTFRVRGYGHGVGMSQTGANSMAKEGKTAEDIIHHFYNEVEIKDIKSL